MTRFDTKRTMQFRNGLFLEKWFLNLLKNVISTYVYFRYVVCSNIHKIGFSIFLLFLAFTRTEKERHANQSTKKKTSDHLFGFSGKLSIQELGYNDYGKGSRLIDGNLTKCGPESSRKI